MKDRILHICNDFSNSSIYTQLYLRIEQQGESQIIFHPLRNTSNVGKRERFFNSERTQIIYSQRIRKQHRFLFRTKIRYLYKSLQDQINLRNIKISVSTTLFSDGAISLKLYKDYGIPYIVCVRHTDINIFCKYRPDLNPLMKEIINSASYVIFISPALEKKALKIVGFKSCFKHKKNRIIPNGIEDFWLSNIRTNNNAPNSSFLFVGKLDKNKNYKNLIKAFKQANKSNPKLTLSLVGVSLDPQYLESQISTCSFISYLGFIDSKQELVNLYREHRNLVVFSVHETFGLVYLEGMSQGMRVGYSSNEGIYGLFPYFDKFSANPKSIGSMTRAILKMANTSDNHTEDLSSFNWKKIALTYLELINSSTFLN